MTLILKIIFYVIIFFFVRGLFNLMLLKIFGIRITSWFRTPWHNMSVGGKLFSRHQWFSAFDVTPVTSDTLLKLREIGFSKIINENDHYHVEI